MQEADRKVAWAGIIVLAVIALALFWLLFIGPADQHTAYTTTCEKDCSEPWWQSVGVWTMVFTGILTGSTILLWLETRRLATGADDQGAKMERSIAVAAQAAAASERHAQAMIASQRAVLHLDKPNFLTLDHLTEGDRPIRPGGLQSLMVFSLPIQNVGGTTAIIETVSFGCKVCVELPGWPPPYNAPLGIGQPIKKDGKWTSLSFIALPDADLEQVRNGTQYLWYFGYVRFRDFIGDAWDVGFVGQWEEVQRGGGFFGLQPRGIVPGGPPIYTYTREVEFEKPP